ncbi:paraquat-inducible protein A [Rhodovulum sulfidophilum]|uniref:Paraquat-inducible protein A n=1 Tax=Rhodovulum sulfidophilum TaxID=35806 RepID=A0A0D6B0Q6_RHOSU|nr:paraquat-inducible protein A [Rhodovulum sulfidophilum]
MLRAALPRPRYIQMTAPSPTEPDLSAPDLSAQDLSELIACPQCDAVYRAVQPAPRARAVCARCHTVLISPQRQAGQRLIAVALTVVVLICAATLTPFLEVEAGGMSNATSVLDAALAFAGRPLLLVLTLAVAALIVFVPVLRALLILYVLTPIVFDRPPARHARAAFRLSETLRPWSMAEVFAIGCAVALVKISDLAHVAFGPAFWMFSALVILIVVQDTFMCRYSVWRSLDR